MTPTIEFDRLRNFLLNLECLDPAGQRDAFVNEIMETGGTYAPPAEDALSGYLFEIALHGVTVCALSEDDAISVWKKAAKAVAPLTEGDRSITAYQSPPFPTPRNHAEEIANARAATGTGVA